MTRWEYKIVKFCYGEDLEKLLNIYGEKGWEFTRPLPPRRTGIWMRLVFRRPKEGAKDDSHKTATHRG